VSRATAWRELWQQPLFRRLLITRLSSQAADGLFQASLVSAVVFDPTKRTGPVQVATGFVVLLLPYSLIGPFAGVFLDRWRRQRVLVRGTLVRAAIVVVAALLLDQEGPSGLWFTVAALAALSVNRFYLAALSAALPSVVQDDQLVLANAVSPTAGTLVTIAGGLAGLALRTGVGRDARGDAIVTLVAAVAYLGSATLAHRLPPDSLGPRDLDTSPLLAQLATVVRGMRDGAHHVRSRPVAAWALGVIGAQRLLYGLWTIMTVLLYRNVFVSHGLLRGGLVGLGQVVTANGVGLVSAAAVTPWVTARIGTQRWIWVVTAGLAVAGCCLELPVTKAGQLGSAVCFGFATQATKVCVDSLVQATVDDDFRGRVFAFYDTLFNVSFVAAALVAAAVLPESGRSPLAVVLMSIGYAAIAVAYASRTNLSARARAIDRSRADHSQVLGGPGP
jgi:MFS family permease